MYKINCLCLRLYMCGSWHAASTRFILEMESFLQPCGACASTQARWQCSDGVGGGVGDRVSIHPSFYFQWQCKNLMSNTISVSTPAHPHLLFCRCRWSFPVEHLRRDLLAVHRSDHPSPQSRRRLNFSPFGKPSVHSCLPPALVSSSWNRRETKKKKH